MKGQRGLGRGGKRRRVEAEAGRAAGDAGKSWGARGVRNRGGR